MTPEQYEADIAFLLPRSTRAGCWSSSDERDYGASANSIVTIAYGGPSWRIVLPFDGDDLAACERMWEKLPPHRKTQAATAAMEAARKAAENWRRS